MAVMPLPEDEAAEPALKRDRAFILTALCAMFVASWAYIISGTGMGVSPLDLTAMHGQFAAIALKPAAWSLPSGLLVVAMWSVLTMAILVPSVAPIVLLHAAHNRKSRAPLNVSIFTGLFLTGFLSVWILFSLAASAVQWTLEQASLMTQALSISDPKIAGAVFIAAGINQFGGVKQRSLRHIRHPDKYIFTEWIEGANGALQMGTNLGICLLGSCWLLVGLLLAGGILNVVWVAGLAGYIMLEKLSGHGRVISIMFGCALTCWGIFLLVPPLQS